MGAVHYDAAAPAPTDGPLPGQGCRGGSCFTRRREKDADEAVTVIPRRGSPCDCRIGDQWRGAQPGGRPLGGSNQVWSEYSLFSRSPDTFELFRDMLREY